MTKTNDKVANFLIPVLFMALLILVIENPSEFVNSLLKGFRFK